MARTKVVETNGNGHPAEQSASPVAPLSRATVSQQSLDMLVMGKEDLLKKRSEIDMLIQRQEGGSMLMQALLQSQGEAVGELDV